MIHALYLIALLLGIHTSAPITPLAPVRGIPKPPLNPVIEERAAYFFVGTTWYVLLTGGTATQCTGLINAPYPGSGTAQPCAVNHPFWLLNSTTSWRIAGGDTVQFSDKGPYYLGQQLNGAGVGQNWNPVFGGNCPTSGAAPNCNLPALPSGTAGNPTRILGAGAASCANTATIAAMPHTTLYGINDTFYFFNAVGVTYPDIECFRLTQPDTCTADGAGFLPTGTCIAGTNNYATHGIFVNYHPSGANQGPINGTFKHLIIDGLSKDAFFGAGYNSSTSDTTVLDDIWMIGNGDGGYNSDSGSCGTSCESTGTINASNLTIQWNGCPEITPTATLGDNGFNYCTSQSSGGAGNGFTMIATGGTWNFSNLLIEWNTKDGFDGLHMGDDITTNPIVNINRIHSEGNGGNQIKIGGSHKLTNWYAAGNCNRLSAPFAPNPTGYNTYFYDPCRAGGNPLTFQLLSGRSSTVQFGTVYGYQTVIVDYSCVQNQNCTTGTLPVVNFQNNLVFGYFDTSASVYPAGLYYDVGSFSVGPDPFGNPGSHIDHNLWQATTLRAGSFTGAGICPQDTTYETAQQCGNPQLMSTTSYDAVDPRLTPISPAIGNGVAISGVTTDILGNPRPASPAIGAYEFISTVTLRHIFRSPHHYN